MSTGESANQFANDGSFLANFLVQQQQRDAEKPSNQQEEKQPPAPPLIAQTSRKKATSVPLKKKSAVVALSKLAKPSIFEDDDGDEQERVSNTSRVFIGLGGSATYTTVRKPEYAVGLPATAAHVSKAAGQAGSDALAHAKAVAEKLAMEAKPSAYGTKRKSRWDNSAPLGLNSSTNASTPSPATRRSTTGRFLPTHIVDGNANYKEYHDAYKPGMIKAGAKWVYPEDEIVDGGTFEHKKRAMEMQLTEGIAKTLTEPVDSGAAHHLAHFIPKDVLRSFEAEVQAKRAGLKTSTKDQYAENKLDESNSGYRLLQKQGWTEGAGLGAQGSGVTVPINGGLVRPAKTGLGQQLGDNVDAAEDDIEVYRKRMMLAYKYRPNPLNNPRRPY